MSTIQTTIYVKTQYEALHCWPGAPKEVSFLAHPHRHVFHVEYHLTALHDDRAVEFFMFKKDLEEVIKTRLLPRLEKYPQMSCEMMAKALYEAIDALPVSRENSPEVFIFPYKNLTRKVIVSEDGENGAILEISN